ncbi:MAG: hypothetical protein PXY39_08360 [archaeon]|nr:hypothetical protein [archaeon]
MLTFETVTENQVWCEFLEAEYKERLPPPYHDEVKALTDSPDFNDAKANSRRKQLLRMIRSPMVDNLPNDTSWQKVKLSTNETLNLYALRYRSWIILSDGTCFLRMAAENLSDKNWKISPQFADPEVSNEIAMIRSKISSMKNYREVSLLPILIREQNSDKLTVIEGCHRIAALILNTNFFTKAQPEVRIYLGTSPQMRSCMWLVR